MAVCPQKHTSNVVFEHVGRRLLVQTNVSRQVPHKQEKISLGHLRFCGFCY